MVLLDGSTATERYFASMNQAYRTGLTYHFCTETKLSKTFSALLFRKKNEEEGFEAFDTCAVIQQTLWYGFLSTEAYGDYYIHSYLDES